VFRNLAFWCAPVPNGCAHKRQRTLPAKKVQVRRSAHLPPASPLGPPLIPRPHSARINGARLRTRRLPSRASTMHCFALHCTRLARRLLPRAATPPVQVAGSQRQAVGLLYRVALARLSRLLPACLLRRATRPPLGKWRALVIEKSAICAHSSVRRPCSGGLAATRPNWRAYSASPSSVSTSSCQWAAAHTALSYACSSVCSSVCARRWPAAQGGCSWALLRQPSGANK